MAVWNQLRQQVSLPSTPVTLLLVSGLCLWYVIQSIGGAVLSRTAYRSLVYTTVPTLDLGLLFGAISHSSISHLVGNITILLVACPYLETHLFASRRVFAAFLVVVGVGTTILHGSIVFLLAGTPQPTHGASGISYATLTMVGLHCSATNRMFPLSVLRFWLSGVQLPNPPRVLTRATNTLLLIGISGALCYQFLVPHPHLAKYVHLTGALIGAMAIPLLR